LSFKTCCNAANDSILIPGQCIGIRADGEMREIGEEIVLWGRRHVGEYQSVFPL
jgi:hypothetical protein